MPTFSAISAALCCVLAVVPEHMVAQASQPSAWNQDFQSAVKAYDEGRVTEAAARLELLERQAPRSFAVHELLGLAYGAQSRDRQAAEELAIAVRLDERSAPARANLGVSLARTGQSAEAETQWKKALQLDPANYTAKRGLAELYLKSDRVADARSLLQAAEQQHPDAADNGYDLALADLLLGRYEESRSLVEQMEKQADSGDLHSLMGRLDEKQGRFIEAANEFAAAARMAPSEDNLFAWGSELLLHRTYEPAAEIFRDAAERYPNSPRLWIGLGMSLYSRGQYEDSIRALLKAADLSPADARAYLFLSKAYLSSPSQTAAVIEHFHRYATLRPESALAQYYYAMSLWKGGRLENPDVNYGAVESLLQRSIALDPNFADAHLQLGILYNDERSYARSLPEYERALALDPQMADAHFRLARYYLRSGEKERAQAEMEAYKRLQAQHQAELDKERAEVQQFVVTPGTAAAGQASDKSF